MDSILGQKWNGRVNIKSPPENTQFVLRNPYLTSQTFHDPLLGIQDKSNLSIAFFSKENVKIIQNALRRAIYEKSNQQYIIEQQDVKELHIVMRSIYLQNSRNLPYDIPGQIAELNKMVLEFCIQQVYSECNARMKYLNDVSTLVIPIAHPINANNTDRELQLHEWF